MEDDKHNINKYLLQMLSKFEAINAQHFALMITPDGSEESQNLIDNKSCANRLI